MNVNTNTNWNVLLIKLVAAGDIDIYEYLDDTYQIYIRDISGFNDDGEEIYRHYLAADLIDELEEIIETSATTGEHKESITVDGITYVIQYASEGI